MNGAAPAIGRRPEAEIIDRARLEAEQAGDLAAVSIRADRRPQDERGDPVKYRLRPAGCSAACGWCDEQACRRGGWASRGSRNVLRQE